MMIPTNYDMEGKTLFEEFKALAISPVYTVEIAERMAQIRKQAINESDHELLELIMDVECLVAQETILVSQDVLCAHEIDLKSLEPGKCKGEINWVIKAEEICNQKLFEEFRDLAYSPVYTVEIAEKMAQIREQAINESNHELLELIMDVEDLIAQESTLTDEDGSESCKSEINWVIKREETCNQKLFEEFRDLAYSPVYTMEIAERMAQIREQAINDSNHRLLESIMDVEDLIAQESTLAIEQGLCLDTEVFLGALFYLGENIKNGLNWPKLDSSSDIFQTWNTNNNSVCGSGELKYYFCNPGTTPEDTSLGGLNASIYYIDMVDIAARMVQTYEQITSFEQEISPITDSYRFSLSSGLKGQMLLGAESQTLMAEYDFLSLESTSLGGLSAAIYCINMVDIASRMVQNHEQITSFEQEISPITDYCRFSLGSNLKRQLLISAESQTLILEHDSPESCSQEGEKCDYSWQVFNSAFLELLKPGNPDAVSLGAFLRRMLLTFHLLGFHSEIEILSEVYLRAHGLIHNQSVEIHNPSAWIKKKAFNVIREWSRNGQRSDSLDREVVDDRAEVRQDRLILELDVAILERAWQSLTAEEQRLLTLKVFDKLSWQEIAAIYASEGKPIAEVTLRQQKTRALKRLWRLYHVFRPLTEPIHTLEEIAGLIEGIATTLKTTFDKIKPNKASFEFDVEFGCEAGQLTAMIVQGTSEADLRSTLQAENHLPAKLGGGVLGMKGKLSELFRQGIVCIKAPNGQGSGFCVAPGWLLSCTHLIQGTDLSQISVNWQQQRITPIQIKYSEDRQIDLPSRDHDRFIGRQRELKKLLKYISPDYRQHITVFDGIGGVGKTALVLDVAHQCWEAKHSKRSAVGIPIFDAIIFTSAKENMLTVGGIQQRPQKESTLQDIFRMIAITLDEKSIIHASARQQIQRVKECLRKHRTLLIVDNFETISIKERNRILAFLDDVPAPTQVIITSRELIGRTAIRLECLSEEEGCRLIRAQAAPKGVTLEPNEDERMRLHGTLTASALMDCVEQWKFIDSAIVINLIRGVGQPLLKVILMNESSNEEVEKVATNLAAQAKDNAHFCKVLETVKDAASEETDKWIRSAVTRAFEMIKKTVATTDYSA